MSTTRTNCADCGFQVVVRPDCPLCGHTLTEQHSPTSALRTLFGG